MEQQRGRRSMEKPIKGDVIVLPFPFSDLSNAKKRPALVVANLKGDDLILAQITSNKKSDDYSINLKKEDFQKGQLGLTSNIRPNRLFTADKSLFLYKAGMIKKTKITKVEKELIKILTK
jgi:mRNA interferase MazF